VYIVLSNHLPYFKTQLHIEKLFFFETSKPLKRKSGLQTLCDYYSGKGALQCQNLNGGCPGSIYGNCEPNVIWSGDLQSGSSYYYGNLNSGTFNATTSNYQPSTRAYGVRCVLDLNKIQMQTDSSATTIQVKAPCSASVGIAAARAPTITTATRTSYGRAQSVKVRTTTGI